MVESVTDEANLDDVDERVDNHRSTETHDTAQPPQSHDNEDHTRDFVDEGEAAAAAPVQSVNGEEGDVVVDAPSEDNVRVEAFLRGSGLDASVPTVTEFVPGEDSVTVPSGEVWAVEIVTPGGADFDVNGERVHEGSSGTWRTMFTGGDTLFNDSNNVIPVTGFEVSAYVSDPVSVVVAGEESVTVPTDQTWIVTYAPTSTTETLINGDRWHRDNEESALANPCLTLPGGTEIEETNGFGSSNFHLGGVVL